MINFIGDIFWDAGREITISPEIKSVLNASSMNIANLEGSFGLPPTDFKIGTKLILDESIEQFCLDLNLQYLNVSNNHALDGGEVGLIEGNTRLSTNFELFGFADKNVILLDDRSQKVAVLSYCENEFYLGHELNSNKPEDLVSVLNVQNINRDIKKFKTKGYKIIVLCHTGFELLPYPVPTTISLFRHLVELGADVVIGNHPHVAQGFERFGQGLICYSLGNFVMTKGVEEQHADGMLLSLDITSEFSEFQYLPLCQKTEGNSVKISVNENLRTRIESSIEWTPEKEEVYLKKIRLIYAPYLDYIFNINFLGDTKNHLVLKRALKELLNDGLINTSNRMDLMRHIFTSDFHLQAIKDLINDNAGRR
jgi:hypothetical protein